MAVVVGHEILRNLAMIPSRCIHHADGSFYLRSQAQEPIICQQGRLLPARQMLLMQKGQKGSRCDYLRNKTQEHSN